MMFKILYPRRIPEQRNPVFVIATLCLCGFWLFTLERNGAFKAGAQGFLVGIAVAVVPVAVYVPLALLVDRYEKEPRWMLTAAFFWGATVASFLAPVLNSYLDTSSVTGAGVEELIKAAALILLFFWQRYEFDNVIDGMVYAAMIGLGFAMTENVHFYVDAWKNSSLWLVMAGRGILSPFSHPLFTAMTGIGLGVARETRNPRLKLAAALLGLGAAVLLHTAWNGFIVARMFPTAYVWIMAPLFGGMIGVVVREQARERKTIRTFLEPYVHRGHLTLAEVETLCRNGGRLRALWAAWQVGGMRALRREATFHQAATELAFHRWRTSRGISHGPEKDAGLEAEYLRQIAVNRVHRVAPSLSA
ncbi:MAG: PrsW family intramembrane metalloprotease [Longimicrobiaceae bacterium]